jgi:N-acetylneuraminic acid mutarotase
MAFLAGKACNHIKAKRTLLLRKMGDSPFMKKKVIPFLIVTLAVSMLIPTFHFPVASAAQNSWTTKKPMPTARSGLGVAVVEGKIYAIGGLNNDTQLAVNEEYNPVTDTWTTKASMPTARSGFAVAVYQNKIYCIGGTTGDSANLVSGFTGATEVYDPATDTWETKKPMPTPRADLCANIVNGRIYCMGGKKYWGVDAEYQELNVTEVYNPGSNFWTTKSPMPIPVLGAASAVIDGKIYVIGGSRHFQQGWELAIVGSNQVYDPSDDSWSTRAGLPHSVSYAAAVATSGVTAPKKIYVVGGSTQTSYSEVTYMYDSEDNTWSTAASMPSPRVYLGLAVVDDILYAIGGLDGEKWLNVNEQYAPVGYGTVPPELRVFSPENTTYTSSEVPLILSVNRPTTWIKYRLDGSASLNVTGDTVLSGLSDGEHTLKVYVNDTFGNLATSDTVNFTVDTSAPLIQVFSPENKTYSESDVQSVFTVNEAVEWMGYSLDGQDNVTVTGNVTLAVLSEGSHHVTFYARDPYGNEGASKTVYFEVMPFPTVTVAAVAVTITIVVAAGYLLLKRRKTGASPKPKQSGSQTIEKQ